jgi:hypothetical protein
MTQRLAAEVLLQSLGLRAPGYYITVLIIRLFIIIRLFDLWLFFW